jgi:hypothetical protein
MEGRIHPLIRFLRRRKKTVFDLSSIVLSCRYRNPIYPLEGFSFIDFRPLHLIYYYDHDTEFPFLGFGYICF